LLVALTLWLAALSLGCVDREGPSGSASAPAVTQADVAGDPSPAVAAGGEVDTAAPTGRHAQGPLASGQPRQVSIATLDGAETRGEATASSPDAATVEELLKDGLHVIGASPVHLAIRGTPAATSVRCL